MVESKVRASATVESLSQFAAPVGTQPGVVWSTSPAASSGKQRYWASNARVPAPARPVRRRPGRRGVVVRDSVIVPPSLKT